MLFALTPPALALRVAKRHAAASYRRAIWHPTPRRTRHLARVGLRRVLIAQPATGKSIQKGRGISNAHAPQLFEAASLMLTPLNFCAAPVLTKLKV